MKVTVKASNVDKALDPLTWPYRVGVRLYRAPQRSRADRDSWSQQSARAGGRQPEEGNQEQIPKRNNKFRKNRRNSNLDQVNEFMRSVNIFSRLCPDMPCP